MKPKYLLGLIAGLLMLQIVGCQSSYQGYAGSPSYGYYPGSNYVYNVFGTVGQQIYSVLTNVYAVYATTFILFFILLYSIFAASIRKVKVFSDDGKISRQGKMAAISLAILGDMGIFYYTWTSYDAVNRILTTMGWFGSLVFAGMVFGITYYNLKTNEEGKVHTGPAWFAAGLTLIMYGMFTNSPGAVSWGTIILIVAAIWAGIKSFGGRGRRGEEDRVARERVNEDDEDRAEHRRRQGEPVPQQVQNFQAAMHGPPNPSVDLSWTANPASDNVIGYQIQRRHNGRPTGWWGRRVLSAGYRDFVAGWSDLNTVSGTSYTDTPVNPQLNYEYRIRAINNVGEKGPWRRQLANSVLVTPQPQPGPGQPPGQLPFGTVAGQVTDINGQPLANVQVVIAGVVNISDANGNYQCNGVLANINHGVVAIDQMNRGLVQNPNSIGPVQVAQGQQWPHNIQMIPIQQPNPQIQQIQQAGNNINPQGVI